MADVPNDGLCDYKLLGDRAVSIEAESNLPRSRVLALLGPDPRVPLSASCDEFHRGDA
jgi:hypothetical protein